MRFLDQIRWRTTVGRTPLGEWSARRRDFYLTTHNTHNRQTFMPPPPEGFEPTISAGELPQTYAWECAATGTGSVDFTGSKYICWGSAVALPGLWRSSGRCSWTRYWDFGFHKMLRMFWLAENLLALQDWLCLVALECITVCLSTRCGSWPTLEAPTAMFPLHLSPTSISPSGWGRKTDRLLC
jgi:hypothetical protein